MFCLAPAKGQRLRGHIWWRSNKVSPRDEILHATRRVWPDGGMGGRGGVQMIGTTGVRASRRVVSG